MTRSYRLSLTSQPLLPRLNFVPVTGELGSVITNSKEATSINTFECDVATDRMMHEHMTRPLFANGKVRRPKENLQESNKKKATEEKTQGTKTSSIENNQSKQKESTKKNSTIKSISNEEKERSEDALLHSHRNLEKHAAELGVSVTLINSRAQNIAKATRTSLFPPSPKFSSKSPSSSPAIFKTPTDRVRALNVPWNRASMRIRNSFITSHDQLEKENSPELKSQSLYDLQQTEQKSNSEPYFSPIHKQNNPTIRLERDAVRTPLESHAIHISGYRSSLLVTRATNLNFPPTGIPFPPISVEPKSDQFSVARKYVDREWGVSKDFVEPPPTEGIEITRSMSLCYGRYSSYNSLTQPHPAQALDGRRSAPQVRERRRSRARKLEDYVDDKQEDEEYDATLPTRENSLVVDSSGQAVRREINHTISATGQLRRSSLFLLEAAHQFQSGPLIFNPGGSLL